MTIPTTITAMKQGLAAGDFTAVDIVNAAFDRIEATDEAIHAFISTNKDYALEQARLADERGYGENAPLLNGIPVAVKDNILTIDFPTTAASKMLDDFTPVYDAHVVTRLKEAGAIILGKLNLDEFAMGGSTETSYFGTTMNPWDVSRVAGGSSGGSGATVAARQVPASLGTDTGGSVRNPASFNGIVGMKPTYGAVSRYGVIAFGSSFDQVGPMTLTVEDNALLLEVLAGHDAHDMTSLPDLDTNFSKYIGESIKGMKIAFPKEFKSEQVRPAVREQIIAAAKYFEEQGAIVEEVSLPTAKYGINVYYIMASAEAASNLQRFDGMRYGYRSPNATNVEEIFVKSRSEGFGDEVKRRIMIGTYTLGAGSFDHFYKKAGQVRTKIAQEMQAIFQDYDIIMGPTTLSTAFKAGEKMSNPMDMYLADLLTVLANLTGIPAISIPAGFDKDHLPIGMQLMAKQGQEARIYQLAHAYEVEHNFVDIEPSL